MKYVLQPELHDFCDTCYANKNVLTNDEKGFVLFSHMEKKKKKWWNYLFHCSELHPGLTLEQSIVY